MESALDETPLWVRTVDVRIAESTAPRAWTVAFRTQAVPGTLAAFAGTLAVSRLDIVSATVGRSEQGMVTETFEVVPLAGSPFGTESCERLADSAAAALNGRGDLAAELSALRGEYRAQPGVTPRVETNTDSSLTTGINVVCADRPGLLYDITSVLAAHHLRARSLAVLTFNAQVHDTFRVVDSAGEPPSQPDVLAALRDDLLGVLSS